MVDIYEIYANIRTQWFLDGVPAGASVRRYSLESMAELYYTPMEFCCDEI